MKLWTLTTLYTVSLLLFSGCVNTSPKPENDSTIDSTLQVVELTQNGVYSDMNAIAFEWKTITDPRVDGIYIYKDVLGDKDPTYKYHTTLNSRFITHYVDNEINPNSKYSYYFRTFSKDSQSQKSKIITVNSLAALNSVAWIHATKNMPRSAKIIWRPHSNQKVKAYLLERMTLENDDWKSLATINGRLNAEYIDSDLKDNFVYKYRIRVLTYDDMISNPSKVVTIVTKPLPKSLVQIKASKNLPKRIELSWEKTDIKDFANYNIYRSGSTSIWYDLIVKTPNNYYVDEIDKDGKIYFYRVSVVDKDGLESNYKDLSIQGITLIKPTAPSMLEATIVNNKVKLKWKNTDKRVKSYIVLKKSNNSWISSDKEEFTNIKSTHYIDSNILPDSSYSYQIYSVDEFGIKSEPSIEVQVKTLKNQGKIDSSKTNKYQETIQTENNVIKTDIPKESIVTPINDIDLSEI